jgi:hypothetical protein
MFRYQRHRLRFVKFVSSGKYPETTGGPDEIETPVDRTVWLWPDSTFHQVKANECIFSIISILVQMGVDR